MPFGEASDLSFGEEPLSTGNQDSDGTNRASHLPVWLTDSTGAALTHNECLHNVARLNNLCIVPTAGSGDCFFLAVQHGLQQLGLSRTVKELRFLVGLELTINAQLYRHRYNIDDYGQRMQAPTYELFIQRTQHGSE